MKDKSGNRSDHEYTVTLLLKDAAPARPTGFEGQPDNTKVNLSWDDPGDSTITKWQYNYQELNGNWKGWKDVEIALTSTASTLTFTTQNWSTAQTATVKLTAAPTETVIVGFHKDDVEFTPSTMTFTSGNWNTTQSLSVKMKAAPAADTTVDLSAADWANATTTTVTGLTNGTLYDFLLRATNSGGTSPSAQTLAVASRVQPAPQNFKAAGGASSVTLTWTDPKHASITKYQVRHREKDGPHRLRRQRQRRALLGRPRRFHHHRLRVPVQGPPAPTTAGRPSPTAARPPGPTSSGA